MIILKNEEIRRVWFKNSLYFVQMYGRQNIRARTTALMIHIITIAQEKLTDGLFGSPTLCPQVVRRFTKHSLTRPFN